MKIEAVIVCYNYSDFLEHTLPQNLQQLDRVIVVTHPDDKKTQQLCSHHGVDYVATTIFHDDGDKFNKARAINLGLSHLRHEDWLVHLDADILLPPQFRKRLSDAKIKAKNIYGVDRQNTISFENYMEHKDRITPQHKWRYLVEPIKEFPLGARLLHQEYGYCPIGYFQLWHSSIKRKYPIVSGSAEHTDVLFAVQWPREERILLPEFLVFHLESEGQNQGINWEGRKSKPFAHSHHHHKHHHHCYCHEKKH